MNVKYVEEFKYPKPENRWNVFLLIKFFLTKTVKSKEINLVSVKASSLYT